MAKKTLKLDINERLEILQNIPSNGGNRNTQRNYKIFKKIIHPTDEENSLYGIRQDQRTGKWISIRPNEDKKDFEFEDDILKEIKDLLELLDSNNNFPEWGVDILDQLDEILPIKKKK